MKIVTVVGARPQFVKAAVVSRCIDRHNALSGAGSSVEQIEEVIVHTGQHYDSNMSDVFFSEMRIPAPKYNLGIGGKSHGAMTGRMLEAIEGVLQKEAPDWLMVYGDTNSTLAGALAARKMNIKVAHVEAGLRSFNMKMPEEVNRILTDRISDILFCPTDTAVENLEREGFGSFGCRVLKTGDVMFDVARAYAPFAKKPEQLAESLRNGVLCTIHRAENTDDPERMRQIIEALNVVSEELPVVFPVHPRTRQIIKQSGLPAFTRNVALIDPVGYLEMIWLLQNCSVVMTDSGGLQKEAYFFGRPCVTLRDETEWVELVRAGVNCLAGADKSQILEAFTKMKSLKVQTGDLYGDGESNRRIVNALIEYK